MIERGNSVSIHIRRFDKPHNFSQFLYRLKLSLVWRVASREYYLKSINYITRNLEHPKFYVFTDNIEWVKKNIPLNVDFIIVDWNRGDKSNLDMYLMSKCKHNIISMSSFSWWGAWLNSNKKKLLLHLRNGH